MRPAILGRPSWSTGTGEEPAGLPLLRVPHLLACSGGVTRLDCPVTGTPLSAPGRWRHGAIRLGRGCWRANLLQVTSEASLNVFCAVGVQRAQPFGAGLGRREAQKLEFSIGPLLFRKAPVQWKTFQGAGVQRVATLWRRGLGTARVPSVLGTAPTVGGWRCGVAVLARPPAQRVALGPQTTLPGAVAGSGR